MRINRRYKLLVSPILNLDPDFKQVRRTPGGLWLFKYVGRSAPNIVGDIISRLTLVPLLIGSGERDDDNIAA